MQIGRAESDGKVLLGLIWQEANIGKPKPFGLFAELRFVGAVANQEKNNVRPVTEMMGRKQAMITAAVELGALFG